MNKLLCVFSIAMLITVTTRSQSKKSTHLYIDGKLPDLTFTNVINYEKPTPKLSDFQGFEKKMVIFDFWNIHCTVCIAKFPEEIQLQNKFKKQVQFVLVTSDPKEKVTKFISNWEQKNNLKMNMPIITEDTLLINKYIRVYYNPQYAWIDPYNRLIAQTNEFLIGKESLEKALSEINKLKKLIDSIRNLNKRDSLLKLKIN